MAPISTLQSPGLPASIRTSLTTAFSTSLRSLPVVRSPLAPPASSDAPLTPVEAAATAVAYLSSAALLVLGTRSALSMVLWRRSLRGPDAEAPAPGPAPLPFLGNVLQLRGGYYETLYRYVDCPASVFWVLSTPFVVVNDEQGVRTVLGAGGAYAKPKYFGYRSRAVKSAVDEERAKVAAESVTYLPDGDSSRVALDCMVSDSLEVIKTAMGELLGRLESASIEDRREMQEDAVVFSRRTVVGLNLEVLFGLSKDSEMAEDERRIADMIAFAGTEFARRMVNPLKVLWDLPGNVRYFRDVGSLIGLGRRLCALLDDAVVGEGGDAMVERSTSGLSWVHAWVGKVGRIGKLGKVVGLLMASTQTVPLTAVWMLHLVEAGEVRDAVRRELKELGITQIDDLTYKHLERMVYADAVIKETLRLYPPFPLIQREAQRAGVLGDVTIPDGTPVYIVPWLIHRNPKYWKDPHEFRPQRFVDGSASHGDAPSDWVYLPFGRGVRMCAGSKLALTELKVLLAQAALGYEWQSTWDESAKRGIFPELGMNPRGMKLQFRKRKDGAE